MRMCQAFAQLGNEVELHAPTGDLSDVDPFDLYGVERVFTLVRHRRANLRVLGAVDYTRRVVAHIRSGHRPDLLYARELYPLPLLGSLRIPYVFESHWRPKNVLWEQLEGYIYRRSEFARVIFISHRLQQLYLDLFPFLPREKAVVAHDAADPTDPTSEREAGPMRVGYVGSFSQGYGVERIAKLAERLPLIDFHVVGGTPAEVARMQQRQSRVNLHFHGFVPHGNLGPLYERMDVCLAPYQASTPHIDWISPMKLFEYMARGKPTVASDFPVIREVLEDGVTGLLVAPDDLEAWVEALTSLADPQLRHRLGSAARERLEREFTWRRRAERVLHGVT